MIGCWSTIVHLWTLCNFMPFGIHGGPIQFQVSVLVLLALFLSPCFFGSSRTSFLCVCSWPTFSSGLALLCSDIQTDRHCSRHPHQTQSYFYRFGMIIFSPHLAERVDAKGLFFLVGLFLALQSEQLTLSMLSLNRMG